MKPLKIAVVGYGILGRLTAWRLAHLGHCVTVFEKASQGSCEATSFAAGGMLAPYSELDNSEASIKDLGIEGLKIWEKYRLSMDLSQVIFDKGSLIVSHSRDNNLLLEFEDQVKACGESAVMQRINPLTLEPDLNASMASGIFIQAEKHLIPDQMLKALDKANQSLGTKILWQQSITGSLSKRSEFSDCDWIIDCRGLGSRDGLFPQLRGVRGEAILLHAPSVELQRPVRVMHPRYALYIVPRGQSHYYLGATQIESEAQDPITVRSSLELLSAAFVVHSGFAEASIKASLVGLRPALASNHPRILVEDNVIAINGLYRHGYLLSPLLTEAALSIVCDTAKPSFFQDLIDS